MRKDGKVGKLPLTEKRLRSSISNGTRLLLRVDHRGPEMRRLNDLVEAHVAQMGGHGVISHSERVLIGRCSMLVLLAEMREARFARDRFKKITSLDLRDYVRVVGALNRLFKRLGLERRPRDITPTLDQYLKHKQQDTDDVVPQEAAE